MTLKMTFIEWFHTINILGEHWFHNKEATVLETIAKK